MGGLQAAHLYHRQNGGRQSTLVKNLVAQDIQNGHGVGGIVPHGQLVEDILDFCPSWRTRDIVHFDPSDNYPIGFNILESVKIHHIRLVALFSLHYLFRLSLKYYYGMI
ncbi:MAG: hypothetical protein U0586_04640 [Candidatus Brocadiaceae bacterium]